MNKSAAIAILREAARRKAELTMFDDILFKEQKEFIDHPARLKCLQTTRRAGKSFACGIYMCQTALSKPKAKILYVTKTRQMSETIMHADIMMTLHDRKGLRFDFNKSKLKYTFANGSMIQMIGLDAGPREMNKALGSKWTLVIIDEAGFLEQDIETFVYSKLQPATTDTQGTIVLASNPSDMHHGLYFEAATGRRSDWTVFKWTAYDNPHMATLWDADIKQKVALNPNIYNDSSFRQTHLNEWAVASDARVYQFDKTRHTIPFMPPPKGQQVMYKLGLDLGFNDATAFVVGAYIAGDPMLYIVHAEKHSQLDATQVREKLESIRRTFAYDQIIADGASKQVLEEIRRRYSIPITVSEKHDKRGFIGIINTEFNNSKIKLVDKSTTQLQDELNNLIWNETKRRANIFEELASCKNDLCDAFNYLTRFMYPIIQTAQSHAMNTQAYAMKAMEEERERYRQMHQEQYYDDY